MREQGNTSGEKGRKEKLTSLYLEMEKSVGLAEDHAWGGLEAVWRSGGGNQVLPWMKEGQAAWGWGKLLLRTQEGLCNWWGGLLAGGAGAAIGGRVWGSLTLPP